MASGIQLKIVPGISRDSTKFSRGACVDAKWCRFYYGKPRKIGGYNNLGSPFPDILRGAGLVSKNGINYYHVGSANNLFSYPVNNLGVNFGLIDKTPATLVKNANNIWQFDSMFDVGSSKLVIFAHAGQNLAAIDSTVQTPVFYGDPTTNSPLTSVGKSVSGGVCVVHPYPILYDNDGFILWPAAGTVNFSGGDSGSARITGSKILKGQSIRGGAGFSPAGLFWSLDELHRIYYVGGNSVFANEKVGDTCLISSSAVVEYNGLFYWPSSDGRFCMWNGGIQDLPNEYNLQYFFQNLNKQYVQKVWGLKVPEFNEIWWHWPSTASINGECDKVLIYNVKDKIWYDSISYRSCGVAAKVFPYPIMWDSQTSPVTGRYRMWQHEFGVDASDVIDGAGVNAIESYFETQVFSTIDQVSDKGDTDVWMWVQWFEPDFIQTGNMSLVVTGEQYPQGDTETSNPYTFAMDSPRFDVKQQRRLLRMKITSNVAGGNYYMGEPMMKVGQGQKRQWQS